MSVQTKAEIEFNTSSIYPLPPGYEPWQIRNDYPPSNGQLPNVDDAPWLKCDFKKNPTDYMTIIKEYCFEGMTNNDFVVQKNKKRDWYHPPWLHYSDFGREPIHGLRFELFIPAGELSSTQKRPLQKWACSYYNSAGASVFGSVWKDPNEPHWSQHLRFPPGSLVFKLLMSEATDEELPNMKGSPIWDAVIAKDGKKPSERNEKPSPLRLLQLDFAVNDDRSPIGWVYGAFVYDGRIGNGTSPQWDCIMPVGLQWGNDPELTQRAFESGKTPQDQWMNPAAEALRVFLKGRYPWWGWNGRMNGPVDGFITACASCHSTAQRGKVPPTPTTPPLPIQDSNGSWIPQRDYITMRWFRNIPYGEPFDEGAISGDYNLQVMIGYENYVKWKALSEDKPIPAEVVRPALPLRQAPLVE